MPTSPTPHTSSGGKYGKPQNLVAMIIQLQQQVAALQLTLAQCNGITFIAPSGLLVTLTVDDTGTPNWNIVPGSGAN